jgi:DNA repair exonuclease SbcCD ATPase subunit
MTNKLYIKEPYSKALLCANTDELAEYRKRKAQLSGISQQTDKQV